LVLNTEEILKRVREKRFKESSPEEDIEEKAEEIRKRLEKEVKKGHYAEFKEIGADTTIEWSRIRLPMLQRK
jgi:hypothetical protein